MYFLLIAVSCILCQSDKTQVYERYRGQHLTINSTSDTYFQQISYNNQPISFCQYVPPSMKYTLQKYISHKQYNSKVLYRLEDIQEDQPLLDMLYTNGNIFILDNEKQLTAYSTNNFQKLFTINLPKTQSRKLVNTSNHIYLVTNNQIILIDQNQKTSRQIISYQQKEIQYAVGTTNMIWIAAGNSVLVFKQKNAQGQLQKLKISDKLANLSALDIEYSNSSSLIYILAKQKIHILQYYENKGQIIVNKQEQVGMVGCQSFFVKNDSYIVASCQEQISIIRQAFLNTQSGKFYQRKVQFPYMKIRDLHVTNQIIIARGDSYHATLRSSFDKKFPKQAVHVSQFPQQELHEIVSSPEFFFMITKKNIFKIKMQVQGPKHQCKLDWDQIGKWNVQITRHRACAQTQTLCKESIKSQIIVKFAVYQNLFWIIGILIGLGIIAIVVTVLMCRKRIQYNALCEQTQREMTSHIGQKQQSQR